MNYYLIAIITFFITFYLLELVTDYLNLSAISPELPEEFKDIYNKEKYAKSQRYLKDNTRFSIIHSSILTIFLILFIIFGGFNWIDNLVRVAEKGSILTGLMFLGVWMLINQLIGLPFSIYKIFVIEEKYGFNKTTVKTFILDLIKGLLIAIIIGAIAFSSIIWFFEKTGGYAWLYCWLFITIFQLIIVIIAPHWIMPLFNKFQKLEEGELRTSIEDYAKKQKFKLKDLYKMDGSKRSTKSNAYFTGIGTSKRIVLFDTLIEKHSVKELVAVLAHEVAHFKKKHIYKSILFSTISSGIMLFLLSIMLNNKGLFEAFKMEHLSIYASLVLFSFLYTPVNQLFSIMSNILSRKHEYEADEFAVKTTHDNESMISALKHLSVDNLSNLTPHWFKVFLDYSHPPVLERIKQIRIKSTTKGC